MVEDGARSGRDSPEAPITLARFVTPKSIEIFVLSGLAVGMIGSVVPSVVNKEWVNAIVYSFFGLDLFILGAVGSGLIPFSTKERQRILYSAGGFTGSILCHHIFYVFVFSRPQYEISRYAPFLYDFQGAYVYLVAFGIGAALACEMELRHRNKSTVMLPMNFFIGLAMGVGTMLLCYAFGLMAGFFGAPGLLASALLAFVVYYGLRLRGSHYEQISAGQAAGVNVRHGDPLPDPHDLTRASLSELNREQDLERFRILMGQLNHEDYMLLSRAAFAVFTQPLSVTLYVYCKKSGLDFVSNVIIWANIMASVVIYISILGAFRVYIETRVKIRPLVQAHPDFPIRRLPDIHPGLGLYCPVALGLISVVVWSSMLYVEAGQDKFHQIAAIVITSTLAIAGVVFAIGVGSGLAEDIAPEIFPSGEQALSAEPAASVVTRL